MSKRTATTRRKVSPWKGTEKDRGYMARVARAQERGEWTAPGTNPNPRDEAKVARKRIARAAYA